MHGDEECARERKIETDRKHQPDDDKKEKERKQKAETENYFESMSMKISIYKTEVIVFFFCNHLYDISFLLW